MRFTRHWLSQSGSHARHRDDYGTRRCSCTSCCPSLPSPLSLGPPTMGRPRLRVAICGAGIGGLVAALCLARYPDIDVTVYEGASRLAEVGAGIGFWPRPREILKRLGLEEELMERSCVEAGEEEDTKFICRKSDQVESYHFYTIQAKGRQLRVHRADFQTVLVARLKKLGRDNVVCSKRLSSYTDFSSSPDVSSSTLPSYTSLNSSLFPSPSGYGTVATCDVLIGADGLKSRVRVGMMERVVSEATRQAGAEDVHALAAAAQPVWSGFVAYRVLISADKLRERAPAHSLLSNPMLYFGKNACIVGYSIQNGACLNVIFFTFDPAQEHGVHPGEWMRKAAKAEFAGAFEGWELEVQAMLDCVDGALRWAVHTTKPPGLPTFAHGSTALLGDAAHSMTPFQGSGAGQAVEDAWLLAHLLGDPAVTRANVSAALRVYDTARRPVAQDVQERSRVNGHLLALNYHGIDFDALEGEAQCVALIELGEQMQRDWEWAWSTSTDGMVQDSLEALRRAVL
ncbi:FAD/NAD(P)-binding domain-containing protein [Schizophyllum commune H4-8]|uniref:FAD-binding domain-containing protein n=1 Tax=Schizophyllum commune (strain H4-8 / FGSC 9210) TaxID=578458 RepID=D8PYC5_SCHCM|nr:FAD/NAD(P)-binding domain-containing protein [Schizophyllum commune H4-8]KAI5897269.1 FAD/NAD(P)-binding domain-containing protein [Schizophyllum commune H4-8]